MCTRCLSMPLQRAVPRRHRCSPRVPVTQLRAGYTLRSAAVVAPFAPLCLHTPHRYCVTLPPFAHSTVYAPHRLACLAQLAAACKQSSQGPTRPHGYHVSSSTSVHDCATRTCQFSRRSWPIVCLPARDGAHHQWTWRLRTFFGHDLLRRHHFRGPLDRGSELERPSTH